MAPTAIGARAKSSGARAPPITKEFGSGRSLALVRIQPVNFFYTKANKFALKMSGLELATSKAMITGTQTLALIASFFILSGAPYVDASPADHDISKSKIAADHESKIGLLKEIVRMSSSKIVKIIDSRAATFDANRVVALDAGREEVNIAAIRNQISSLVADIGSVESVLYPMCGADSGLAFGVFPDAKVVIGIDDSEFVAPGDHLSYSRVTRPTWTYSGFDRDNPEIVNNIIGSIAHTVPSFRLRRVFFLESPNENHLSPRESQKWLDPRSRHHGIVEFDNGEGTPVRRYIHLDHLMGNAPNSWLVKLLKAWGPKAVLIKAAHQRFSNGFNRFDRSLISNLLEKSGGILVEGGENAGPQEWEFSPPEGFSETDSRQLRDVRYGYTGNVQIIKWRGSAKSCRALFETLRK